MSTQQGEMTNLSMTSGSSGDGDGGTSTAAHTQVAPTTPTVVHDVWAFRAAVVAIGVALSVFLIGTAVIFAVTKTVPDQYWTAGSAISGALIGILVPAKPDPLPSTASAVSAGAATQRSVAPAEPGRTKPATIKLLNENLRTIVLFTIFVVSLILGAALGSSQELHSLAAASGGALIGVLVPAPSKSSG
jgi:hypothetical protein